MSSWLEGEPAGQNSEEAMAEVKPEIPEDLAIRYEKASRVVSAQAEERVDFSGKLLAAAIYNWAASDKELIERIAALDAVRKELIAKGEKLKEPFGEDDELWGSYRKRFHEWKEFQSALARARALDKEG